MRHKVKDWLIPVVRSRVIVMMQKRELWLVVWLLPMLCLMLPVMLLLDQALMSVLGLVQQWHPMAVPESIVRSEAEVI